jgi:hypothetical protein
MHVWNLEGEQNELELIPFFSTIHYNYPILPGFDFQDLPLPCFTTLIIMEMESELRSGEIERQIKTSDSIQLTCKYVHISLRGKSCVEDLHLYEFEIGVTRERNSDYLDPPPSQLKPLLNT